jgi:hypothetical protein
MCRLRSGEPSCHQRGPPLTERSLDPVNRLVRGCSGFTVGALPGVLDLATGDH